MYTEYSVLQRLHSDVEEKLLVDAFKYHHFRQAWYSYIQLMSIDYSKGFCCVKCGRNPTTLIMDGTAISFRRALDSWHSFVSSILPAVSKSGR